MFHVKQFQAVIPEGFAVAKPIRDPSKAKCQ